MTARPAADQEVAMAIEDRIKERYADLSPQARRAADALLDHVDDLALYSSAELATISGVSQATLSRLYRQLGFTSFAELREEARSLRRRGVPLDLADRPLGLAEHLAADTANLQRCLEGLDPGVLASAVDHLAHDHRVVVVGLRNSHPVALHLRQQLVQVRPGVGLAPLPGQTLGEDLADLGPDDTVVLVGFRRRRADFRRLLDLVAGSGAYVLLVADGTARHHAGRASAWLECPVDAPGPFDSYAAAMALVSVLASAVAAELGERGRRRVQGITRGYATLEELDD